jgi:flagellar hook-associated protein 3 FlgL
VAAAQSPQTRAGLIETAKGFLSAYGAAMGQDMAGVALFGGSELTAPAVAAYDETRASGPAAVIASAFQATFGFSQDDPAVATIDAAALGAFLDGDFAAQFAQPAWSANWSRATDQAFRTQIAPGERVATTVSANEAALRDMAQLAVMVADLGADKLNESAFTVFASKAASLATRATDATLSLETRMGVSRQRIGDAQIAMDATRAMLARQIGGSEDVDPAEAAMRINDLTSRLEATFAVTARLRGLSLLDHL